MYMYNGINTKTSKYIIRNIIAHNCTLNCEFRSCSYTFCLKQDIYIYVKPSRFMLLGFNNSVQFRSHIRSDLL